MDGSEASISTGVPYPLPFFYCSVLIRTNLPSMHGLQSFPIHLPTIYDLVRRRLHVFSTPLFLPLDRSKAVRARQAEEIEEYLNEIRKGEIVNACRCIEQR